MLLHALVDAAAVILSRYAANVWIVLGVVYVIAACYALLARAVWKKCASDQDACAGIPTGEEA